MSFFAFLCVRRFCCHLAKNYCPRLDCTFQKREKEKTSSGLFSKMYFLVQPPGQNFESIIITLLLHSAHCNNYFDCNNKLLNYIMKMIKW